MAGTATGNPPQGAVWRRWRRFPTAFRLGAVILLVHLLFATLGPSLVAFTPTQMATGQPLSGMSLRHLFGVDQLGRDVFSRTA